MKYCSNCGAELGDSAASFCSEYGKPLQTVEVSCNTSAENEKNVPTRNKKKSKKEKPAKQKKNKKAMFEMAYGGGSATAHDVFMALQEIPYLMKIHKMPEAKMLVVEENMARALTLKWNEYDLAKAVNY